MVVVDPLLFSLGFEELKYHQLQYSQVNFLSLTDCCSRLFWIGCAQLYSFIYNSPIFLTNAPTQQKKIIMIIVKQIDLSAVDR